MSRIPLPVPFGQALSQGITTGANLAAQQARENLAASQLAMAQQMQPWKVKMIQAQIAQAQADEAYKQKILPGLIQAQKDAHARAILGYDPQAAASFKNALFNDTFGQTSTPATGMGTGGTAGTTPNMGALAQPSASSNDIMNQLMNNDPASQSLASSGFVDPSSLAQPQQSSQPTPVMPPAMAQIMAQQVQSQMKTGQPIGTQQASQPPQQGMDSSQITQSSQLTPLGQVLQRVQTGTATPVDYMKLNMAGFNIKPGEYETPQQKEQLAVQQATQIAQAQAGLAGQTAASKAAASANVKKANTAIQNLRNLASTDNTLNQFSNIVQNNPAIFSYIKAPFESKFSGDPDVGTVNTLAGPLIATMTKSISQRGGAQVANMVKNMKPGLDRSPQVAAGNITGLQNISAQEKVNNILDYHDATGEFPNVPGMEKYVALAKQQLQTGQNNTVPTQAAAATPSFAEGYTRKIGNNSYVWSGGKWHHS